jgi:putative ABC transport system substrate-binding protein
MRVALLSWLAAALLAAAGDVQAQTPRKVPQVAFVFWQTPVSDLMGKHPGTRVLRESLAELGWVEGRNISFRWASAEGDHKRSGPILDELIAGKVDVLVVSGDEMAIDAKTRTRTLPIVMLFSAEPVTRGIVDSLTRPGGNVTGVTVGANLHPKRLAFLKELAPGVTRVAVLLEDEYVRGQSAPPVLKLPELEQEARSLGVTLVPVPLNRADEIETAIAEAVRQGANGLYIQSAVSASTRNFNLIRSLAERHKLPAAYRFLDAVAGGGLMGYGPDESERYRQVARYVDRILRGARPGDLPVEATGGYRLVINAKAANAIGLQIPQSLAVQADQVIR